MSHNVKLRKLTSSQIRELRQAFDLFDTDNSGGISVVELKQALGALGVKVTDQEARQMFSAIDIDKNGRIEFEEFADVVADSYFKKFSRAEILEAFQRFDHNHDGYIEVDELKSILARLGRNFSNDEVRRMIAQVDRDGNGKISIEEFAALVENH
ncbi:unnamed protein product [Adineta steineri]|uniref:EF-hand domain-containing protein n=1 Tax=Adineta steineri TaxID=433720 RepID=A0A818G1D1_9BILA|nr:unnamed protein product [Adineta steineri]CAF0963573.1 unnamed protein product [Adineta steineri]CAF3482125.1 unnamed protein product [Adineta steineri]CAF3502475.1 unnamed protein product [Adineta steineri]